MARDAEETLRSMVAADSAPTLSGDQIDALLASASRPDASGILPGESGYTQTFDLNAAAAEGWRWKAAKAAGEFTFASDGQQFNRSDVVKACMEMAKMYRNRVVGSIPLALSDDWDTDIAGNVNAC